MISTVSEVKTHLRIDGEDEDTYLTGLITQVDAMIDNYCRVEYSSEDSDDIPADVKLAELLMIGHFYEYRDNPDKASYDAALAAFQALLYPNRDPAKMF